MAAAAARRTIKHTTSDYLHVDYLEELNKVKQLDMNGWLFRFNRVFVKLLGCVACVDLTSGRDSQMRPIKLNRNNATISNWLQKSLKIKGKNLPGPKLHWISYVLLLLYFLFSAHIMANMIVQYSYDFDQLRLRKLKNGTNNNSTTSLLMQQQLQERINRTKSQLDSIGAPYSHLSIGFECFDLYTLLFSFLVYYLSHLYYCLFRTFDLHVVREQLDYQAESGNTYRLIEFKVHELWTSSEMYARILRQYGQRSEGCRSQRANKMLLELYECGALRPYNKSLHWFARRSQIVFTYQLLLVLYTWLFFLFISGQAIARNDPTHTFTWQDVHLCLSLMGLILMLSLSSTLYCAYFLSACLDQIVSANKIRQLIERCININTRLFVQRPRNEQQQIRESSFSGGLPVMILQVNDFIELITKVDDDDADDDINRNEELLSKEEGEQDDKFNSLSVDKMNSNLLFILLQYKIFVAQHKPAVRSVESAIVFVTGVLLLIPIIVKLHLPYVISFGTLDSNIRLTAALLCLTIVVPVNICIFPLCYMHSRCVGLYRQVAYLMAHVADIESQHAGTYNTHSIMILLKELRHPDRFVDQFKPRLIGLEGTFVSMVKVNLWWGLIVTAILFDSQTTGRDTIESLFSDPLGVF